MKGRSSFLFICFSLFFMQGSYAQSLEYLNNFLVNKLKYEKDSSAVYIDKYKVIAEARNDKYLLAEYYYNLGQWEHFYGEKSKAKKALMEAKHLTDPLEQTADIDTIRCEIYYSLADQLSITGDATGAAALSIEAVDICEIIRETVHFANATYGAAINHLDIGQYAQALYYMSLTYEHDLKRADSSMIAADLNVMGKIAHKMYDYQSANRYFLSSINFVPKKNRNEASIKKKLLIRARNIGSNYFDLNQLDSAYLFFNSSLQDAIELGDSLELAQSHLKVSQYYKRRDSLDQARYHAARGLGYIADKNERIRQTLLLAEAATINTTNPKALNQIESVLRYAQKNENASLESFALSYSAKLKEQLGNHKGALNDMRKLQALKTERMTVAQRFAKDKLNFNSEILQKNHEVAVLEKQKAFEEQRNELFITRAIGIGLALAAALGGLLMYLRYRNKKKILAMENQQLKKEKEFAFRINELESETFRAQMNPHFMFNSLNSINHFILANEPRIASKYLTKFAALMRIVLNHSKEKLVPLNEEVRAMELYLELEKLRSQDSFDYSIEIEPSDLFAQIPPMLIQPYLENAIWHGVIPRKETNGQISLKIYKQDQRIFIDIMDNGIGREAAKRIKTKSNLPHRQSKALSITAKRLELITKYYGISADVHITDLYDGENATGTLVQLSLPHILAA